MTDKPPRSRSSNRRRTPNDELADAIPVERSLVDSEPVSDEKPKPPPYREGTIAKALTGTYGSLGMMVGAFDMHCGQVIVMNAEAMAQSWEKLAKTNPAVKRVLLRMMETSAVAEVLIAHAPVIAAIMSHHGPPAVQEKIGGMFGAATNDNPQNGKHEETAKV